MEINEHRNHFQFSIIKQIFFRSKPEMVGNCQWMYRKYRVGIETNYSFCFSLTRFVDASRKIIDETYEARINFFVGRK